jgi:hypothetical protein
VVIAAFAAVPAAAASSSPAASAQGSPPVARDRALSRPAADVLWHPPAAGRDTATRTTPLSNTVVSSTTATSSRWRVEPTVSGTVPAGTLLAVSCASPTSCVAVGLAANRAGTQVVLVEHWNAGRWRTQAAPVPSAATDAELTGVSCSSATSCIAVGYFYDHVGRIRPLADQWDGATWTLTKPTVPSGSNAAGFFAVSCTSSTDCTAVGTYNDSSGTPSPLVERWDGATWAIQPVPAPTGAIASGLFGVSCTGTGGCTAVGSFMDTSDLLQPLIETSGGGWTTQTPAPGVPNNTGSQLSGVACTSTSSCVAVGSVNLAGGALRSLAETWDGTQWSASTTVEPMGSSSELAAVSCSTDGQCTAVGEYGFLGQGRALAERWNGTSWARQGLPAPVQSHGFGLAGAACPETASCIAVGGYVHWESPVGSTLAYVWNGGAWQVTTTADAIGAETTALRGVSCPSTRHCQAVGLADTPAGLQKAFATVRSGSRWHIQRIPSPTKAITSQLNAVACVSASKCIAVGNYSLRAETATALAERWDGHRWRIQRPAGLPKATNFANLTSVACTSAHDCIAVGNYWSKSGRAHPLAEHWNGRTWQLQQARSVPKAGGTELVGVSCPAHNVCTAVGFANGRTVAERWNGQTWTLQHAKNLPHAFQTELAAVSCSSVTNCLAVGTAVNSADRTVAISERWHHGSWRIEGMPIAGGHAELADIACGSNRSCVAVGFKIRTGPTLSLVETWNGRRWAITRTPLPTGTIFSLLNTVSCPTGRACTAVGYRIGRVGIQTALAVSRR